jgi:hypothetical protein
MPELPDVKICLETLRRRILLAHRSLSRVLGDDWPGRIDELES